MFQTAKRNRIRTLLVGLGLALGFVVAVPGTAQATYACPAFPPNGGVCLYEPTDKGPRYGRFHSVTRNSSGFDIPWPVGFIDVNSTTCGLNIYKITYSPTYPYARTSTYLFTAYQHDNHYGEGGYVVPSHLHNDVDFGGWSC